MRKMDLNDFILLKAYKIPSTSCCSNLLSISEAPKLAIIYLFIYFYFKNTHGYIISLGFPHHTSQNSKTTKSTR